METMSDPWYYRMSDILRAAGVPESALCVGCHSIVMQVRVGGVVEYCCFDGVVYVDRLTLRGRIRYLWRSFCALVAQW